MIKFGNIIVNDWGNSEYYDTILDMMVKITTRNIVTDEYYFDSIVIFPCFNDKKELMPDLYYVSSAYELHDYFELIHGKYFYDRLFKSIDEAKEYVDFTLDKIIKLRAFL